MTFLTIEHLEKSFGPNRVVKDFNLAVEKGEFVSLLGPSGCGKTTVLRMVAGFETPSAGRIAIDGADVVRLRPNQRNIGMVFQAYALFPNLTVAQNVGFGLKVKGTPRAEIAARVAEMLALIGLPDLGGRYPFQLSGGQQQRVALARALAARPRILLLDEPLSALDMKLRKEMQVELKRLQQETGLTFIFVTHDQEEALTMSDRIAVMAGGRIQQIASPRDLYDQPANRFVAGFIGETNFLPAHCTAGRLTLPQAAASLPVPHADGPVTVMIRPEHVALGQARPDALVLTAQVDRLVYFGTDTHVHLHLSDGSPLVARVQNALRGGQPCAAGQTIPVSLPGEALRLLPCDEAA